MKLLTIKTVSYCFGYPLEILEFACYLLTLPIAFSVFPFYILPFSSFPNFSCTLPNGFKLEMSSLHYTKREFSTGNQFSGSSVFELLQNYSSVYLGFIFLFCLQSKWWEMQARIFNRTLIHIHKLKF